MEEGPSVALWPPHTGIPTRTHLYTNAHIHALLKKAIKTNPGLAFVL